MALVLRGKGGLSRVLAARVTIGADRGCDVVVAEEGVAAVEVEIEALGHRAFARCGPHRQARLNGRRFELEELRAGDRLQVAGCEVDLVEQDAPASPLALAPLAGSRARARLAARDLGRNALRGLGFGLARLGRRLAPGRIADRLDARLASMPRWPVALAVMLATLLAVGAVSKQATPPEKRAVSPVLLSATPARQVFGRGEGLGVTAPVSGPLRLRFESGEGGLPACSACFEVRSPSVLPVEVSLNGAAVGSIWPAPGSEQCLRLPRSRLRAGVNELVLAPPPAEGWAVAGARIERRPVPEGEPRELEALAAAQIERAREHLRLRDVAAANRFEAFLALQRALSFLDGVEPASSLEVVAAQELAEVETDLQRICRRILLTAMRHEQLHEVERAVEALRSGLQWFPGEGHPCRERLGEALKRIEPAK